MAVDPNLADAQQVAATVLVCLGEHEEALRYVRRCLRLTPGLPDFYLICNAEALILNPAVDPEISPLSGALFNW